MAATAPQPLDELLAGYANPADRLDALADIVEADPGRWTQDAFHRDRNEVPADGPGDRYSACLIGMAEIVWPDDTLDTGRPLDRVAQAIRVPDRHRIAGWNDDSLRTPGEVAEALRETARLERGERNPAPSGRKGG